MLSWFRESFGKIIVTVVIALIALVFVFEGVFYRSATRGLHEGAVAGTVNGETITIAEFNRELNRRSEFFKGMMGGNPLTEEQLKMFRVREMVFGELVQRKLLVQEAERQGRVPSDSEIRERIQEIPAFTKEGRFDFETYKSVLDANRLTPGSFERMMREDLVTQNWSQHFKERVKVSPAEVRAHFEQTADRRKIKYVLLTSEAGRRDVAVSDAQVAAYLKDPMKLAVAKGNYEAKKETTYKGKTFEQVQTAVTRDLLASEQVEAVQKANQALGERVRAAFGNEAAVNALLKPYGFSVKTTDWVSRQTNYIPGIGEAKELLNDAFGSGRAAIDLKAGGKPKAYQSAAWVLVAGIADTELPVASKFAAQSAQLERELLAKKEREIFSKWMKELTRRARVDANPDVAGATAAEILKDEA